MKVLSLKLIHVSNMVLHNKPKLNQTVSKGFAYCDGERRKVSVRMTCLAMLNTTTESVIFFEKSLASLFLNTYQLILIALKSYSIV